MRPDNFCMKSHEKSLSFKFCKNKIQRPLKACREQCRDFNSIYMAFRLVGLTCPACDDAVCPISQPPGEQVLIQLGVIARVLGNCVLIMHSWVLLLKKQLSGKRQLR